MTDNWLQTSSSPFRRLFFSFWLLMCLRWPVQQVSIIGLVERLGLNSCAFLSFVFFSLVLVTYHFKAYFLVIIELLWNIFLYILFHNWGFFSDILHSVTSTWAWAYACMSTKRHFFISLHGYDINLYLHCRTYLAATSMQVCFISPHY